MNNNNDLDLSNAISPSELSNFFSRLSIHYHKANKGFYDSEDLIVFFKKIGQFKKDFKNENTQKPLILSKQEISDFFLKIETPIAKVRQSAFGFDPWEMIGKNRNEVFNSRILSWLLDGRNSHGLGYDLLNSLLIHIQAKKTDWRFPPQAGRYCRVSVERCPLGVNSERLDIDIDDENFYLVIEVKIDASENVDQLQRYARTASSYTQQNRPWGILFLTVDGRNPITAEGFEEKCLAISWRELAKTIRVSIFNHIGGDFSKNTLECLSYEKQSSIFMALSFVNFIEKF